MSHEITVWNNGVGLPVPRGESLLARAKAAHHVEHQDWLALFTEDGLEWDGVEQHADLMLRPRTLP